MESFERQLENHTRWIERMANSYGQTEYEIIKDLEQEGRIGLFEAFKRFNPEMGYKFLTYAKWWIKKYQITYLNEHGRTIRLPINKIINEKFIPVTDTISLETVPEAIGLSLHEVLGSSDTEVPFDVESLLNAFNKVKLKDREKDIILMYYGFKPYNKHTLQEIGEKYTMTKEGIRQIINKILIKLKKNKGFMVIAKELI